MLGTWHGSVSASCIGTGGVGREVAEERVCTPAAAVPGLESNDREHLVRERQVTGEGRREHSEAVGKMPPEKNCNGRNFFSWSLTGPLSRTPSIGDCRDRLYVVRPGSFCTSVHHASSESKRHHSRLSIAKPPMADGTMADAQWRPTTMVPRWPANHPIASSK